MSDLIAFRCKDNANAEHSYKLMQGSMGRAILHVLYDRRERVVPIVFGGFVMDGSMRRKEVSPSRWLHIFGISQVFLL